MCQPQKLVMSSAVKAAKSDNQNGVLMSKKAQITVVTAVRTESSFRYIISNRQLMNLKFI